MEGTLTGVARSAPEGGWVPGVGIEFPCEYALYGVKKDREIVGKLSEKYKSQENGKEKTELRTYVLLFTV